MLELKVATTDVTNGNVAVAWCVDEATLKYLSDRKVVDPQVVIVVAPTANYSWRREYRKVVPLKDLMTYLEFRSSGENKIWAFISTFTKKKARAEYLTKSSGEYSTTILSEDGDGWGYNFRAKYVTTPAGTTDLVYSPELPAETLTVNVPTGVFAKDPAKWEKTWVNHWFRAKAVDQCDFRRRRLLAYTVQPLAMLLDVLVARVVFSLVAFMWLSRGLSFKYFIHPLAYSLFDTLDVFKGGTWTIAHLPEDDKSNDPEITISYVIRKLWKIPLMPLALFPLWLIVHYHVILWMLLAVVIIILISILVLMIADGVITKFFSNLFTSDNEEPTPWYMDKEEMEAVTCNPSFQKRTSVSALPAKHRTIHLRFQDLKAKVCRPFSV